MDREYLTPHQLIVLVAYGENCFGAYESGPNFATDREKLIIKNMIKRHPVTIPEYTITERGRAYLDKVMSTPLPIQKWVIPNE